MDLNGGRTKGTGISHTVQFVRERFGEEAFANLITPRVQEAIGLPLDSISLAGWYPTAAYRRLLDWVTDRFLDADPRRCTEIGAFGIARDFRGIYKAFALAARPSFLLRMAPKIWTQYQDSGRLRVTEQSETHCVIEIDLDPSIQQTYVSIGGTVRALELVGAKEVSFKVLDAVDSECSRIAYRCDWR